MIVLIKETEMIMYKHLQENIKEHHQKQKCSHATNKRKKHTQKG